MRRLSLLIAFSLLSAAGLAQNAVIVVIDGVRFSESFGAGDATIPSIWQQLRPQGMIWENFTNDGVTYTCPGHASMESGTWQTIPNDGSERPSFPTIFEYFRKETGLDQSACAVITGKPKLEVLSHSTHPDYGAPYGSSTTIGADDLAVFDSLRTVLARDKPRIVLVSLLGTDGAGHAGVFEDYLAAIRLADSLISEIWKLISTDPFYAGNTTLFVTNDHGRHDDEHGGFQHHGDSCLGCRHIMLLAIGRLVPPGRVSTTARSQIDIATTVGSLLGFATPYAQGGNLLEDPVTASPGRTSSPAGSAQIEVFPNPFNGLASITITLAREGHVQLAVHDLLGRTVQMLKDGFMASGRHKFAFDAGELPSGTYAIRLTVGELSAGSQMLLVK